MKRSGIVMLTFAFLGGCSSGEASDDDAPDIGNWSAGDVEYELAVHDNGGTAEGLDEIAINRYRALLGEVDSMCVGSRDDLVRQLWAAIDRGADEGFRVNVLEELDSLSVGSTLTLQEREQLYGMYNKDGEFEGVGEQLECSHILGRQARR